MTSGDFLLASSGHFGWEEGRGRKESDRQAGGRGNEERKEGREGGQGT